MTFDEIMEEIYEGVEYEPLPERAKSADIFVELAKRISEIYELDVKIVKSFSHISVDFCFNSSGCMGFLKHIMRFADDISFFANINGYDIVMSIDPIPMRKQDMDEESIHSKRGTERKMFSASLLHDKVRRKFTKDFVETHCNFVQTMI